MIHRQSSILIWMVSQIFIAFVYFRYKITVQVNTQYRVRQSQARNHNPNMATTTIATKINSSLWHLICVCVSIFWMRPSIHTCTTHNEYNLHSPKHRACTLYNVQHRSFLIALHNNRFVLCHWVVVVIASAAVGTVIIIVVAFFRFRFQMKKKSTVTFLNYIWKWWLT